MSDNLNELSQTAVVDLLYAKAEIEGEPDYPAVLRALHHIGEAERALGLLADELKPEEDGD